MDDSAVLIALLGIFSAVVTAAFSMATWSQKKVSTTQDALVTTLKEQIVTIQDEKKALILDNKEQATVIGKLGVSVDKLTEQGAQTIKLLEDVVYGRQAAQDNRRQS